MIPKVAHFYWYGDEEMPALRRASFESFSAVNPGWEVLLHHSGEDQNATLRQKIVRSDAARYGILSRAGGVYFDTDIVFLKPIPAEWLTRDLLLPCNSIGQMYGVHVLGCSAGSEFFRQAVNRAWLRMDSPRPLGCQSLGVKLWDGLDVVEMAGSMNLSVVPVPVRSFLLTGWEDVEDLWGPSYEIRPDALGVHWYGGDPLSREYEDRQESELPDCMVRAALERARVPA